MGFLDRAKAMAEQAQQKLDEVQKDFNAKQSGGATAGAGAPPVQYDSAGRPIGADAPPEVPMEPAATGAAPDATVHPAPPAPAAGGFEPPAAAATAPEAPPAAPAPPAPVAPDAPSGDPLAQAPAAAPAPPQEDATPGLTSGDPLAG